MIHREELRLYLDKLLNVAPIPDYCPNGLQVQGANDIKSIISGVTASLDLINFAIAKKAQAILVHHGYFWKNEDLCIVGMKHKRIQSLIKNNINLFAYHLPLDVHAEFGNNYQLAQILDLTEIQAVNGTEKIALLNVGKLRHPVTADNFSQLLQEKLLRTPLHIASSKPTIESIAWCTGAAQDFIEQAVNLRVDAFLTGEVSERTVHIAREADIHFFAAGHHATERYGVAALGEHLAEQFGIQHEFIEIPNPA